MFLGIPATGCQIIVSGIHIIRVENNLIVENWAEMDIMSAIQQISKLGSDYDNTLNLKN